LEGLKKEKITINLGGQQNKDKKLEQELANLQIQEASQEVPPKGKN